ncbi:hypothetical protein [Halorussus halobius]|uniref:hypothetical protein n=1 Tax=Halorussus halobius TaxID=1710537 RepID=UPI0010923FA7
MLVVNLLPLVGSLALDWAFVTVVQLYCLDAVGLFVAYGLAATFARPGVLVDERERTHLPVLGGDWTDDPRRLDLHRSLPPLYPRNLRTVVPTLVAFVCFVIVPAGIALTTRATISGPGRRPRTPVEPFVSALSVFASPLVLGTGLAMAGVHLLVVPRRYFRRGEHEATSAYVTLERPARFVAVYAGTVVVGFVAFLLTLALVGVVAPDPVVERVEVVLLVGGFYAAKMGLERLRFRSEESPDCGGIARWLVPADPHAGAGGPP